MLGPGEEGRLWIFFLEKYRQMQNPTQPLTQREPLLYSSADSSGSELREWDNPTLARIEALQRKKPIGLRRVGEVGGKPKSLRDKEGKRMGKLNSVC